MNTAIPVPDEMRSRGRAGRAQAGRASGPSGGRRRADRRPSPFSALRRRSSHARLVLWLGIVALALNALVGIGHVSARGAGNVAGVEICTDAGVVRVDSTSVDKRQSEAPAHAGEVHCCDLCGARCMTVIGDAHPHTVAMRVFGTIGARAPPPADGNRAVHPALTPIIPRAPPANT